MSRVKYINDIPFGNFFFSGSVSSTTAVLTKGCSIYIPANTFKDNDVFRIITSSYNSSGTNTWYSNFYWNTGNTITGAIQISTSLGASGNEYMQHSRTFKILDKNGGTEGTLGVSVDKTNPEEYTIFSSTLIPITSAFDSYILDWTKDSYLMVGFYGTTAQSIRNAFLKIYTF